jgi:hypothetical protein
VNNVKTFHTGTLTPRGIYIRQCESRHYEKEYFANKADTERNLRLALSEPKNWLSLYFSKEPTKTDIIELLEALATKLSHEDYEVTTLENFIGELK